jgi:hypothetical protein
MILQQIFEAVRRHYLAGFRQVMAEYRERGMPGRPEVLLELGAEGPDAYRYYRVDFLTGAADDRRLVEFKGETHLDFEPVEVEHKGVDVSVSPLAWNCVELCIRPELADDSRIQEWGRRWIDLEGSAVPDDDGLGSYVHVMGAPESAGGATLFWVDFGSAPIASVFGLLDALRESGARSIEMHSRGVLEEEGEP